MSEFENLDQVLTSSTSGPMWNEDGKDYAGTILSQFTTSDWNELRDSWRDKNETWQSLLADMLSLSDDFEHASQLLLDMITSNYDMVVRDALESLRFLEPSDRKIDATTNQRMMIEHILKDESESLAELQQRMEHQQE